MANAGSSVCEDEMIELPRGSSSGSFAGSEDEHLACLVEKETVFMAGGDYLQALHSHTACDSRSTAVHWILEVQSFYKFRPLTVALAVNYLDRYLSNHLTKPWKAWMIHLLSVSCLSLAAKMEEVDVPLPPNLQILGLGHAFEAKTIQRMELAILSSLDWRMSSVTIFSYVDDLICRLKVNDHLHQSLAIRVTELLLGSLSEADFLEFRPSVITLSAIGCALEEVVPLQAEILTCFLLNILPVEKVNLDRCSRLMEECVVDPECSLVSLNQVLGNPSSPVTMAEACQKKNAHSTATRNCPDPVGIKEPEQPDSTIRTSNLRKRMLEDMLN